MLSCNLFESNNFGISNSAELNMAMCEPQARAAIDSCQYVDLTRFDLELQSQKWGQGSEGIVLV